MPIITQEQGSIDTGRSRAIPVDTYSSVRPSDAGQNLEALSKSLGQFSGTLQEGFDAESKRQLEGVDQLKNQINSHISSDTPLTAAAINDFTSDKHYIVRARVQQGMGEDRGISWAQEQSLKIDHETANDPIKSKQFYDNIRTASLAQYGENNPIGNGFAKGVNSVLDKRAAGLDATRAAEWTGVMKNDFVRNLDSPQRGVIDPVRVADARVGIRSYVDDAQVRHPDEAVAQMNPVFVTQLDAMVKAMPEEVRKGFKIASGYRSNEDQADLTPKYGLKAAPGRSRHNVGEAADISEQDGGVALNWIKANATKYGLELPHTDDPNHLQLSRGASQQPDTLASSTPTGGLLSLASSGESRHNYNIRNGEKQATTDLTSMTITDVLKMQSAGWGGESTAAGRFQVVKGTLQGAVKALGIDPDQTKYDEATQNKIADYLVKNRGFDAYKAGTMSGDQFVSNLRDEWAYLKKVPSEKILAAVNNGTLASGNFARDGVDTGGPANRIQSSSSTPNYIANDTGMRDDVYQRAQNFGILDNSFKVTSSLTNSDKKNAAVDFMITKATDPNNPDAAWLKMVPDRLLDPGDRAKINKAIHDVVGLSETKERIAREHTTHAISDAEKVKSNSLMEEVKKNGFVDERTAAQITYRNHVTGKDETMQSPHLLSLARSFNSADSVDPHESFIAAAGIKDRVTNAFTTKDWSAFPDLPIDPSTGRPTDQNLLQYLAKNGGMNRSDITDTMKGLGDIKIAANAVNHPAVHNWYDSNISKTITMDMSLHPLDKTMAGFDDNMRNQWTALPMETRAAFDGEYSRLWQAYRQDHKGQEPGLTDRGVMLKEAGKVANDLYQTKMGILSGATPPPPPVEVHPVGALITGESKGQPITGTVVSDNGKLVSITTPDGKNIVLDRSATKTASQPAAAPATPAASAPVANAPTQAAPTPTPTARSTNPIVDERMKETVANIQPTEGRTGGDFASDVKGGVDAVKGYIDRTNAEIIAEVAAHPDKEFKTTITKMIGKMPEFKQLDHAIYAAKTPDAKKEANKARTGRLEQLVEHYSSEYKPYFDAFVQARKHLDAAPPEQRDSAKRAYRAAEAAWKEINK